MRQPLRLSDELLLLGRCRLGVELLVRRPLDGHEGTTTGIRSMLWMEASTVSPTAL